MTKKPTAELLILIQSGLLHAHPAENGAVLCKPKKPINFEQWVDKDGSYSLFPSSNKSARQLLGDGAKLINVIEANSWEEARQRQREILGWDSGNQLPEEEGDRV